MPISHGFLLFECDVWGFGQVLCGVCELGFHNSGQSCTECVGVTKYAIIIVILAGVLGLCLFVYVSRKFETRTLVSGAKILVSYFQVVRSCHHCSSILLLACVILRVMRSVARILFVVLAGDYDD
jgi:hypothetical protein